MTEDAQHISNIVSKLNGECYDSSVETGIGLNPFEFTTNGDAQAVTFMGSPVWQSEEDLRDEVIGNPYDLELLEVFIRAEANKYLDAIKLLKF